MSRRARRSASKNSAPVVVSADQRALPLARAATVAPERGRRRSDATLIEASVTARLLGMKLLTLDAKVALVPADVTVVTPRAVREPVARAPALASGNSRGRGGAAGHRGLADAVRDLDEGARLLAEVQRRSG
jgi:hypothetical protein